MYGVPGDIHKNIIWASNLLIIATLLSVINLFFTWEQMEELPWNMYAKIGILFSSYMMSLIVAWLVRLGKRWIRIPLLILTVFGSIFSIPQLFVYFTTSPWSGLISALQLFMQLYAAIILFKPETSEWYTQKKWERMN